MRKNISRDESKQIMLAMMDALDDLCKEHGIHYFLYAGTLLGAVRHKGFIPWDDDVDIALPVKEYERLLEVLRTQDKYPWLSLVDDKCSGYYYPFAKAVDNRTIAKQEDCVSEYGIWIDLFPLYKFPDEESKRKSFIKHLRLYNAINISMVTDFVHAKINKKWFLKVILKMVSCVIGKDRILRGYLDYAKKYENQATHLIGGIFTAYDKEYIEPADAFPTVELEFEGRKYQAPACWDRLLKRMYNDYMQLPPLNKRKTHGVTAWWK